MIGDLLVSAVDELDRLLARAPQQVSLAEALIVSVLLVAWGNAVVVLSRRSSSQGSPNAGEILTLCVQLGGSVVSLLALALLGWTAGDLGVAWPRFDRAGAVGVTLVLIAAVVVVVFGTLGLSKPTAGPGEASTRLQVLRLLGGTAGGEEAFHRGFSLAVWCGAGVTAGNVVVANAVIFALWHIASAWRKHRLHPIEIIVPGVGALLFLWSRLTFGSLLIPWLLHAATNIPGVTFGRKT